MHGVIAIYPTTRSKSPIKPVMLAELDVSLAIEEHLLLERHAQGDRSTQSRLRAGATKTLISAL